MLTSNPRREYTSPLLENINHVKINRYMRNTEKEIRLISSILFRQTPE